LRVLNFRSKGCVYADVHITLGESVAEAMSTIGQKNATNDHAIRDFDWSMPSYSDMTTNESGFRFACIRLKGKNVSLHLKSVVAVSIYQDLEYKGSFRCSDERLNKIFDTAAYTCHLCIQNELWDGIKRDRLIWVGDVAPELKAIKYLFGEIPEVGRTLSLSAADAPLPLWINKHPSYSLWWLINLAEWLEYTGKSSYLAEHAAYLRGLAAQILENVDERGDFSADFFLDWPSRSTPELSRNGVRTLLLWALRAADKLLRALGDGALAADRTWNRSSVCINSITRGRIMQYLFRLLLESFMYCVQKLLPPSSR
jgi:hypothetical protein